MKYQTQNGWTKESMVAHIKAEFKGKSVADDNSEVCLYRGPNGTKCAVGMFIPNNLYNTEMEGKGIHASIFRYSPIVQKMPLGVNAMMGLQGIHDTSHPDITLEDMLQWIENNVE